MTNKEKVKYNIFDLANAFLSISPMNEKKLQILCYYAKESYLGIYRENIIPDDFQAWVHGPVNVDLYNKYKSTLYDDLYPDNDIEIPYDLMDLAKEVYDVYGEYSSEYLEYIVHHYDEPYINAREGYSPWESCTNVIKEEDMKDYYNDKEESVVPCLRLTDEGDSPEEYHGYCPCCGNPDGLYDGQPYCDNCGAKINWDDEEVKRLLGKTEKQVKEESREEDAEEAVTVKMTTYSEYSGIDEREIGEFSSDVKSLIDEFCRLVSAYDGVIPNFDKVEECDITITYKEMNPYSADIIVVSNSTDPNSNRTAITLTNPCKSADVYIDREVISRSTDYINVPLTERKVKDND